MSQETHPEDRTILAALVALEEGHAGEPHPPDADPEAETLARLYREVLGLLPYELDPTAPRPEVKRRLMELVGGEETQEVRGVAEAMAAAPAISAASATSAASPGSAGSPVARPAQPAPSQDPVSMAHPAPGPTPVPVAAPEPARPRAAAAAPSPAASRWPFALAAALAVALLGLAGWMYLGGNGQRETIAGLEQQVKDLSRQVQESDRALRDANTKLHDMRGHLSLVTQYAVEANPLRPVGDSPLQPNARGVLFVAPDHKHWYLSVQNLQPPGPGKQYQLWFMTENSAVSGGTFTAEPGERAQLSSPTMPAGITAVMVTLEGEGGAPAPTGPEVLRVVDVKTVA